MRKKYYSGGTAIRGLTKVLEKMGGDEKAKPHSTKKGRIASGARRLTRRLQASKKN